MSSKERVDGGEHSVVPSYELDPQPMKKQTGMVRVTRSVTAVAAASSGPKTTPQSAPNLVPTEQENALGQSQHEIVDSSSDNKIV